MRHIQLLVGAAEEATEAISTSGGVGASEGVGGGGDSGGGGDGGREGGPGPAKPSSMLATASILRRALALLCCGTITKPASTTTSSTYVV